LILDSKSIILDESKRLDRFLLLLQFDARVERDLFDTSLIEVNINSLSILDSYILSCRFEIILIVIRKICDRFEYILKDENVIKSNAKTIYYMTNLSPKFQRTTLEKTTQNFMQDQRFQDVLLILKLEFYRLAAKKNLFDSRQSDLFLPVAEADALSIDADETTRLLPFAWASPSSSPSPQGWKVSTHHKFETFFQEPLTKFIHYAAEV
jgi:hypothetical protein